ncbi:hypothetical protein RvY_07368-4 [Ramazzottius varieornatus]|uniref:Uncharacterized protein n=1 Tax=Ramazzottius varieornatus TaxID=947166 RepID=A0A1D1V1W9_RAMVA|nr:hypothetical protein RvY_07368-4 [Ramazzottius varieornatus]
MCNTMFSSSSVVSTCSKPDLATSQFPHLTSSSAPQLAIYTVVTYPVRQGITAECRHKISSRCPGSTAFLPSSRYSPTWILESYSWTHGVRWFLVTSGHIVSA